MQRHTAEVANIRRMLVLVCSTRAASLHIPVRHRRHRRRRRQLRTNLNVQQIYGMWCEVFVCRQLHCTALHAQFRTSPEESFKINELELYAITSNTKLFRLNASSSSAPTKVCKYSWLNRFWRLPSAHPHLSSSLTHLFSLLRETGIKRVNFFSRYTPLWSDHRLALTPG